MTRFMLLAGAAALAIGTAAAAAPQQGKGNKGGHGQHAQKQAKGHGKADRGKTIRVARSSNDRSAKARRVEVKHADRGNAKAWSRGNDRAAVRVDRKDRVKMDKGDRLVRVDRDWDDNIRRGGVWSDNGCPPGLAKKPVSCVPPGQVKNLQGQVLNAAVRDKLAMQALPTRLRSLYRDTDDYYYRYGNGYVYKVDRDNDVISSLLPLFGLGATVGQPFPAAYSNAYMPASLRSFYPDSPYSTYKYANGYVYKVDPVTGLIEDVDPMLGYGYGYGQMMPASYSAYNVPYQYRSFYPDSSDYYYRYAPGSIYRVDAGSGLIDSVSALLMPGGISVGQQLPLGYSAYNVPYQYRSQYYDTPQNMYRYSNGYIYQVDPTTQLVKAIISALI